MTNLKGKQVIIRSYGAGVFFGKLADYNMKNNIVELHNARRLWYWDGAASISQIAKEGVKLPKNCKFTVTVDQIQIAQVIEVIPCTDQAINNINNVPVWKK